MKEWRTLKLRTNLLEEIGSATGKIKVYGVPKYDSVPDFIQEACIALLAQEGYRSNLEPRKKKEAVI